MSAISKPLIDNSVVLPATYDSLTALHTTLDGFWQKLKDAPVDEPDAMWWLQFDTAVIEISSNIIRHAYGDDAVGMMGMRLRLYRSHVVVRLSDMGKRFVPSPPAGWHDDDLLSLPESGMGLAIARMALDHVGYRRTPSGVNCWRLLKRFR